MSVPRRISKSPAGAVALTIGLVLSGCTDYRGADPVQTGAELREPGTFSILIGGDVDRNLGTAKVSVDGKVLGHLDTSCGLIAKAQPGAHEVVVEWDRARISEIISVASSEMTSMMVTSDLQLVLTDPVEREAPSCRG
ncbi:MAG: hypothetical protein AAF367_20735 [Pseudomonadota bacterium]